MALKFTSGQTQERMFTSARAFAGALSKLAETLNADISQVYRRTILDVYNNITLRSPVDTGTYRASHGIAVGPEPSDGEGIHQIEGGAGIARSYNDEVRMSFKWTIGKGTIWLYNNVPYAEALERGHSGQAPEGVYALALQELATKLEQALEE